MRNLQPEHLHRSIDGRLKVIMKDAVPSTKPVTIDSLGQLTKIGWTEEMIERLVLED